MRKNGVGAFLRRKQYVIAGVIVVIAAVGTTVLYSSNQEKERERLEAELAREMQEQQPEMVAAEDGSEAAEASAVIPPETTEQGTETAQGVQGTETTEQPKVAENGQETEEQKKQRTTETAAGRNTLHFSPEDGIIWPMEGNVILNYSMDSTVYFPTLDQYKYNPAVIIAGEVNNKVYSVAQGKVEAVESNEVTGCTVTVDLGDGYRAIYGQLKEPKFKVGDYVESGHVLGYVAEPTKYFSVEGSNLYFALQKDGQPVDPIEFFE